MTRKKRAIDYFAPDLPATDCEKGPVDMSQHITPEIRARAAAEWDAMDERGQLPDDRTPPRSTKGVL